MVKLYDYCYYAENFVICILKPLKVVLTIILILNY